MSTTTMSTTTTTAPTVDTPPTTVSAPVDATAVSDRIASIGWLVDDGDHRGVRRAFETFWWRTDDLTRYMLAWSLTIAERYPHTTAVAKLRRAAATAPTADLRALISYVADHADPALYREPAQAITPDPDSHTDWAIENIETRALLAAFGHAFTAAQREHAEIRTGLQPEGGYVRPVTGKHPENNTRIYQVRQGTRSARRTYRFEEPKVVTEYVATRLGVDDEPVHAAQPDGYALDYDRAALWAVRTTRCVSCWIERPAADAYNHGRRSDDSLCSDCRHQARRDGITDAGVRELPDGYTRAEFVAARCAFIADHYPQAALTLLRAAWREATDTDRNLISDWVDTNPVPAPQARQVQSPAPARVDLRHHVRDHRNRVAARCAALAARYPADQTIRILNGWMARSDDRDLIAAWIQSNAALAARPDRAPQRLAPVSAERVPVAA